MNFENFQRKFHHIENAILGGISSQFKLAPEMRIPYSKEKIKALNPQKAGVLALFYPKHTDGETYFLLIERAAYNGTHSSQISFPGGKFEKNDHNIQTTALRESHEEVGIIQKDIRILKQMTNVYIPPSNFLVTPYVGFVPYPPKFSKNIEVETIIEVKLSELLDDNNISCMNVTTSYAQNIDVPCFKLNNYMVWGATAMMLSEIKELLK